MLNLIICLAFMLPVVGSFDDAPATDNEKDNRSDSSVLATSTADGATDLIVIEDVHVRFQDRAEGKSCYV